MLKAYIVITITTFIMGILASARLRFNKNIKTEAKKIKEERKGEIKVSGDGKIIRFFKYITYIVLPILQIISLFGSIYLLLVDENKIIESMKKVYNK